MKPKIVVAGYGYWGPNLVRNLIAAGAEITHVIDPCPVRRSIASKAFPIGGTAEILTDEILDGADGLVIATPVATHFDLIRMAVQHGLDVLVEKPMVATMVESNAVRALVAKPGSPQILVDHTFLFSPVVHRVVELLRAGTIGDVREIHSERTALGRVREDVNVIWDLAAHDVSIAMAALSHAAWRHPTCARAWWGSAASLSARVEVRFLDTHASLFATVSWCSPVKTRRMVFHGDRGTIVYDEGAPAEPIRVYSAGVGSVRREDYRAGDVHIPYAPTGEPLRNVADEFLRATTGKPITTFSDHVFADAVVSALDAATRSANGNGELLPCP